MYNHISPEVLDSITIYGGLGTSAKDVHSDFEFVLQEAVLSADEAVAAFDIPEEDRERGMKYFGALRCDQIIRELAEQDARQHQQRIEG